MYHFDHVSSFNKYVFSNFDTKQCIPVACDSAELEYVFLAPMAEYTPNELVLSNQIQSFWSNFAKKRINVVSNNNTKWKAYDQNKRWTMVFDTRQIAMKQNYDNDHCNFWDQLGYYWLN